MQNAERFAIGAVVRGLRKSGVVDDDALAVIAMELDAAAEEATQYGTAEAIVIERLAKDVRSMQNG